MSQTHPATNINPNDDDLGTGWDIAVAVIVGEETPLVTVTSRLTVSNSCYRCRHRGHHSMVPSEESTVARPSCRVGSRKDWEC